MRRLRSITLGVSLLVAFALPAAAHSTITISPLSQSRDSGQLASWTVGWNGSGSTRVVFCYGDGTPCPDITTNAASRSFSHTFYECVNKTFQQTAYVTQGGHTLGRNASTSVSGGGPC